MAVIDFPNTPIVGQLYTNAGRTWMWDGVKWNSAMGMPLPPTPTRNRIINGGFDVWQRGPGPFSGGFLYCADQWVLAFDGSGATRAITRQTATGAQLPGVKQASTLRFAQTVAGTGGTYNVLLQRIEDVRTLAGETVTLSWWAKADAARTIPAVTLTQLFGTGGSPQIDSPGITSYNVTTTWQRFTYTTTLGSVDSKTIGANNYVMMQFVLPINQTGTFEFYGVQLEAGPVATPFEVKPYANTLAECQYYLRAYGGYSLWDPIGWGVFYDTTHANIWVPCTMRVVPSVAFSGTWSCSDGPGAFPVSAIVVVATQSNPANGVHLTCTVSGVTARWPARLDTGGSPTPRLYLSAEL